jgi:50S ribosomal protein L16 3-hydroxylase
MTYSIGFRSPQRGELARELLLRLADDLADAPETLYRDPSQPAVDRPGGVPADLQIFAREAVEMALDDPLALARVLGEYLTEPKQNVWFESADGAGANQPLTSVVLDRRSRMAYDEHHIFINGEAYRAAGRDATLMRQLADQGRLDQATLARASTAARDLLQSWYEAGWLQEGDEVAA